MRARVDIYSEREEWRRPLIWSAAFHITFFTSVAIYGVIHGASTGSSWGAESAGGEALQATLVSKAAIPLPRNEAATENIVSNENPGLTQSQPKQAEIPTPEAIPIPDKSKPAKQPKPSPNESKVKPTPDNSVPYGAGGPVNA